MKLRLAFALMLLGASALHAAPALEWHATWIAYPKDDGNKTPEPAPLFRKPFTLAATHGRVARATAYISGLGSYELEINGQKVGDEVLAPGWTNVAKTCLYDTLDITPLLHPGPNCAGIILGNGPYNVLKVNGRYTKFTGSFGVEKAISQIVVEFADGARQEIVTDPTWKAARGPITFDHQYGGEDYDARLEIPHWSEPTFDDATWQNAVETKAPAVGAVLRPALQPPVKVCATFPAKAITQPTPGVYVYDLGQNMSGWPRLTVSGPTGTVIKLIPGELLDKNGLVSQRSSGGPVWFSYTLKGGGQEIWEPRFSYYGFRYVQLTGAAPADASNQSPAPDRATVKELAGRFIHADLAPAGDFSCSNDTLNRIHTLINNAVLSNAMSVITDCPHREKLGWLEQTHLVGPAIMMNWNVKGLYQKMANDMAEAQTADGLVPDIAPEFTRFAGGFRDSPEWGSAVIIDPWLVYQQDADKHILADHFESMKRYVAYLGTKASNMNILSHGLGDWYDLGPNPPGVAQLTSTALTATAVYYQDVEILRQTAQILGKPAEAETYTTLAGFIKTSFNAKFFHADTGQYEKGSQTANAMPLAVGLVPETQESRVLDNLVEAVRSAHNQITAGDVGFSYVVRALTDHQRGDVLFDMATHPDGPGYVDQLNKGATTLTEAWDALPSSSQNHLMLGHIETWFYRGLAGLSSDPAVPGYKHFFLQPQCVPGVDWVTAHHDTPFGRIGIHWERTAGKITFTLDIPPTTSATVTLPGETTPRTLDAGHHTLSTSAK